MKRSSVLVFLSLAVLLSALAACSNDDDDACNVTDPNSDCYVCQPDDEGNCTACDPTDPESECYVCDETDPNGECYCDPTDLEDDCYCDPGDPESECYECDPNLPLSGCYECDPFDQHTRCYVMGFNETYPCESPALTRSGPELAEAAIAASTAVAEKRSQQYPVDITGWDWGDGIVMYSILKLHEAHPNETLLNYATDYLDYHINKGHHIRSSNHVTPGASAAIFWEATGQQKYLDEVDATAEYLFELVPTLDDGSITHHGNMPFVAGPSVYVDSLWMFGLFNFQAYVTLGEDRFIDLQSQQTLLLANHLLNADHDLWHHRYDEEEVGDELRPSKAHFWARGNAWAFGSMALWLELAPADHPDRAAMTEMFVNQAEATAPLQRCDGLWDTVMNDPIPEETYPETSASALMSYGFSMGVRLGILDSSYAANAELALEGLLEKTVSDADGTYLLMTSEGTDPVEREDYNAIFVNSNVPWGVGTYALAALAYEALVDSE